MAKRFGRNQKHKLLGQIDGLQRELEREIQVSKVLLNGARLSLEAKKDQLAAVLRDQLSKGVIPLEVEHFLSPEQRSIVMHTIFDERRTNLHYQHAITPNELKIQRDNEERERFGDYLGRAIADRIADAYAGRGEGSSKENSREP